MEKKKKNVNGSMQTDITSGDYLTWQVTFAKEGSDFLVFL